MIQTDNDMNIEREEGEGGRKQLFLDYKTYWRTSISGTTFSGKKCLSGTIFHAI
jgi:hypothetical protein